MITNVKPVCCLPDKCIDDNQLLQLHRGPCIVKSERFGTSLKLRGDQNDTANPHFGISPFRFFQPRRKNMTTLRLKNWSRSRSRPCQPGAQREFDRAVALLAPSHTIRKKQRRELWQSISAAQTRRYTANSRQQIVSSLMESKLQRSVARCWRLQLGPQRSNPTRLANRLGDAARALSHSILLVGLT